jgi:DNA-binding MarR family transcriptional regulator
MRDAFILEEFLPFRLNRLAAEVSVRLAALYGERFNLDIPQWRVLATLSAGICTAEDIVGSTRTHKSTISRAVQELEARRLIGRTVSGSDKRAYHLQLTSEGRKLFRRLRPLVLTYEEELVAKIPTADIRALLRGLRALEHTLGLKTRAQP